ncbi:MAG: TetR/AcrR family transcriptional regulator [Clostridia bacterium]|nr:TetR/AcrR family transcriptional regulator [Clostridia bacterium]
MYCGTNKTALQSQKQVSEAMMALLGEKSFSQITISELCKAAGISRQTFYTLFTSRENVMLFTLQARYCDGPELNEPERTACQGDVTRWLCRGYSDYILRNRSLIKLLVDNHIDYLLYDSFYEAMDECDCFLRQADPCTRSYAARFYAGGFACVARHYAEEGCASSADQLESLLMTLLSGKLFQI